MTWWTTLALTFLLAVFLTGAARPVLLRLEIVDHPNQRSSHTRVTLRGGGAALVIAIGVGYTLTVLTTPTLNATNWTVAGILLFGLIGMFEDARGLSVRFRILAQTMASLIIGSGLVLSLGLPAILIAVAAPLAIFAVNAANFMDGVNGISAFHGIIAGTFAISVGLADESWGLLILGSIVAGAYLGFLPWNAPRARLFLGDSGSYLLGAALWTLSIWLWWATESALVAVAPLFIYSCDVVVTLIRRGIRGASLTEAHREHAYQRIRLRTDSHLASASLAAIASVIVCAIALATWSSDIEPAIGWLGAGVVGLSYQLTGVWAERSIDYNGRRRA